MLVYALRWLYNLNLVANMSDSMREMPHFEGDDDPYEEALLIFDMPIVFRINKWTEIKIKTTMFMRTTIIYLGQLTDQ